MARFRGVAQPGSALRSGRRGPQFESGHPDLPSLPRSILVLFACAAVLLAAGCGGGSSRLSETAFRTKANGICKDLSRQEKADAPSTAKAAVDRNITRLDEAVRKLERLRPPAGDERRYKDFLMSFKQSEAFLKAKEPRVIALGSKVQSGAATPSELVAYQQFVRPFVQHIQAAAAAANDLSLADCANGLSGGSQSQPSK
jgi:hypothetical protein